MALLAPHLGGDGLDIGFDAHHPCHLHNDRWAAHEPAAPDGTT